MQGYETTPATKRRVAKSCRRVVRVSVKPECRGHLLDERRIGPGCEIEPIEEPQRQNDGAPGDPEDVTRNHEMLLLPKPVVYPESSMRTKLRMNDATSYMNSRIFQSERFYKQPCSSRVRTDDSHPFTSTSPPPPVSSLYPQRFIARP